MSLKQITVALALAQATAHPLKPIRATPFEKSLALRGGFVSPTDAAKVAATLVSANGAMMALSPSKAGETYGMEFSPMEEWIAEGMGFTFVGAAIMSWLALNGASTNTVIGCGILPQLVQMTKTLLNDTPKKLGVPAAGMIFNFGLCAFSVYALLTGQSYADNVAKFMVGFFGLNGVVFAVAPSVGAGAWGITGDDKVEFLMKNFGFFITSWAVLGGAVIKGEDAAKAIGYSFVPCLLGLIDGNLISKSVDKFGMAKNPQYFWAVVQIAIIAATLLQ